MMRRVKVSVGREKCKFKKWKRGKRTKSILKMNAYGEATSLNKEKEKDFDLYSLS